MLQKTSGFAGAFRRAGSKNALENLRLSLLSFHFALFSLWAQSLLLRPTLLLLEPIWLHLMPLLVILTQVLLLLTPNLLLLTPILLLLLPFCSDGYIAASRILIRFGPYFGTGFHSVLVV